MKMKKIGPGKARPQFVCVDLSLITYFKNRLQRDEISNQFFLMKNS